MAASPINAELLLPSTPYDFQSEIHDDANGFYRVVTEGKNKKYVCSIPDCQKAFRFHSEMQRHMAAHSSFRPHRCPFEGCQREFKRTGALENHIRSQHTGEAPLVCPHPGCGLKFSTEAKHRYHLASHMEEKPFKCQFPGCDKSFMTNSQLKQHEKSPTVHRKVGLIYKVEENDEKHVTEKMEDCSDGPSVMVNPAKKVKYDTKTKKLDELLNGIISETKVETVPEVEKASEPILDQIMIQNELLRKRLESSEQMLALMRKQIETMNCNVVDTTEIKPLVLSPKVEVDTTNWAQEEESFLIHDPLAEDMISYFREEKFEMKGEVLDFEKMNFLLPNFSIEDFGSPLRHAF